MHELSDEVGDELQRPEVTYCLAIAVALLASSNLLAILAGAIWLACRQMHP